MSASPVIAMRGLSKRYGDVVALEGLDLEVAAGECVALIGHNGSGKTTTMRLAAGQLEPTSGSVSVAGEALDERIDVLLDVLDLDERRDFLPVQLSRGMRQKTQLACTLVRPFQVLLLDEPVVGLDPPSQANLRELLEEAKSEGIAIVLSTHQLHFSDGLADRAVVLHDGRVIDAGDYKPVVAGEQAARLGLR